MIVILQTTWVSGRLQDNDKKKVERRTLTGRQKEIYPGAPVYLIHRQWVHSGRAVPSAEEPMPSNCGADSWEPLGLQGDPVNPKGNQPWIFIERTDAEAESPIFLTNIMMWKADSLEKTLMLGKIEGKSRRGQHRIRWPDGIIDSMDTSLSKPKKIVKDREAWCAIVHGVAKS